MPDSTVTHALCRWLGVEVAVKELHGTNSVQSNAEMFGEAETLNSLRHPCIIAFYGVVVNQVCTHTHVYTAAYALLLHCLVCIIIISSSNIISITYIPWQSLSPQQ